MRTDILITGGGIGGAVLARMLARAGKGVMVIERDVRPPAIGRPEVLWPETAEFLFTLLPEAVFRQRAMMPLGGLALHTSRRTSPIATAEDFAAAQRHPWTTNPDETRAALLAEGGFTLRRGVETMGLLRNGDRIVGARVRDTATGSEEEITAAWTVGDDGARSVVRRDCGIAMDTALFPVEFFCFGIDWPSARRAEATGHLFLNPHRHRSCLLAAGALPFPGGRGGGFALVDGRRFDAASNPSAEWEEFATGLPELREFTGARVFPQDFFRVKRFWGHAERYGVPGCVLMGDAIHPVSPAGGQGANMSVHDARAIADLILQGDGDVIAEYERRRRPANARSVAITRGAARLLPALRSRLLVPLAARAVIALAGRRRLVTAGLRRFSRAFLEA